MSHRITCNQSRHYLHSSIVTCVRHVSRNVYYEFLKETYTKNSLRDFDAYNFDSTNRKKYYESFLSEYIFF